MTALIASAALLFAGAQPVAAADRSIVVITIDGLPAYLLDDPRASLPVIRGLMSSGASAVAGMRVSNPSVTWPNHTTLMTGVHPDRHGVLFNGLPERQGSGLPVRVTAARDQRELVRVPLLFDVLKEGDLSSAAINWPCTRNSASLADNVVPEGGIGMVYLTDPRTAESDRATVRQLLRDAEGVAAVLEPGDFARHHLPRPEAHPGMADLNITIGGPTDDEIWVALSGAGFLVTSWEAVFRGHEATFRRKVRCELRWRGRPDEFPIPAVINEMARRSGVTRLQWKT